APMMRCAVFQANGRSVCLFALHHAIVDGWSAGVFVRELDALVSDAQPIEPDTDETDAPEYADYVEWQSERLESGALDEQLAFWSAQMSEPPGPLFDAPLAPATKRGFPGRQQPVALERGTVAGLDRLSQRTGVTLSTVLLTGYYATLATVFEREDLCIGLARSNRDRRELRDLLGCFVNTLPVRAMAHSETPFSGLLAEVNEAVINAVSNCDVPLDAIARAAMPARATLALQAAFVFKTTPAWLPEIVEKIEQLCSGTSKIELGLDLTRDGEHVAGFFEYDTGRLSRVEAEELAEMYRALMAAAASDPDAALADLSEKAMRTECRTRELERL
ncbi:MAG: condensation domain-containing protein, partial [Pseudomonadota bacterium]